MTSVYLTSILQMGKHDKDDNQNIQMKQKLESYMNDELNSSEDFSKVRLSKKIQYKIKNICGVL
jgi:hypothetical protein